MSETFRDDRLEHDARLAELYRTAAREEPPPTLDDAIRAAARRAVASRPPRVSPSFVRAWRVPLSIAAVMVLTVSLVTVMREEAPEIVSLPGDVRSVGETDQLRAGPAVDVGERTAIVPKTLTPTAPRPDRAGLRPPAQTGASGLGLRENKVSPAPAPQSGKDLAAAELMRISPASAPVPATRPGMAAGSFQSRMDLPPDKWLERIEDLRRQGRLEEAKTNLDEFRKRYPDYELPASIKAWAGL